MKLDQQTALLVVSMQGGLHKDGQDLSPDGFETTVLDLLSVWRGRSWPIYHYKFNDPDPVSPFHSAQPGNEWIDKSYPRQGEEIFEGNTPCAFVGTAVGSMLRMAACEKLVICGGYLNNQVDATARHAKALGFDVAIVPEATVAHAQDSRMQDKTWSGSEVWDVSLSILENRVAKLIHIRDIFSHL